MRTVCDVGIGFLTCSIDLMDCDVYIGFVTFLTVLCRFLRVCGISYGYVT